MAEALLHIVSGIFGSFKGLMAPLSGLAVSVVYYRSSPPNQPVLLRMLASAHGLAIAFLCILWVFLIESPRAAWHLKAFQYLCLVPIGLIVASFALFKGPRKVHLLQGVNLGSLAFVFFAGSFSLDTHPWF